MLNINRASGADAEFIYAASRMEHVAPYIKENKPADILARLVNPNELYLLGVDASSKPVGFAHLVGLKDENQSVELRQLAITQSGRGYGSLLIRSIFQEMFVELGKNRLWLDVFPQNTVARSVYARCGFVEEGTMRDAYRWNDRFQSSILATKATDAIDTCTTLPVD